VRLLLLFLLAALLLSGQVFKLYLKDGNYHLVREYQVQGDRVRYYSTERSEWEEIPLQLVDLTKTEQERLAKQHKEQQIAKKFDEEEQAERELQHEIDLIPQETGAYYRSDGQVKALPPAEYKIISDKKRAILKTITPVPLVPGKSFVVIQGEHSQFIVHENRPQFYIRPAKDDQFGIARLTSKKDLRVVESVAVIPVENADIEERHEHEIFTQQLADNLFKIWPEKPLTPGEYAIVEYSGTNYSPNAEIDLVVWDFAYQPR
jgi:hypothetical protein